MQDATIRNKVSVHMRRKFWTFQIHQQSQPKATRLEIFTEIHSCSIIELEKEFSNRRLNCSKAVGMIPLTSVKVGSSKTRGSRTWHHYLFFWFVLAMLLYPCNTTCRFNRLSYCTCRTYFNEFNV